MSKVFNMVGGGGGLATSIFVTGLSETDTVTATNGSKTLTGKWATIQKMVDAQIPTMTSNTTPSGVVSSTSDYSDEYSAWKAFDGKETSTPGWAPSTDADLSNTYCQYEFNESINPKEIRIGFGGNGFTFDVKASSDGVNFVTLASNISNSKDAWSIVNVKSDEYYKYYRFYMINATGAPSSGYGQKFNIIGTKLGAVNGHMIKPIRDFGTWTVTATDGIDTYTQDVLVDVITEYEIEITKKLYLYRDGDECVDVTGGWTGVSANQVYAYKRDTYMEISTSSSNGEALLETNNIINLTRYSTLHILYDRTQTNYKVRMCITTDKQTTGTITTGTIITENHFPKTIVTGAEMELNVSSVESGYIVINGDNSAKFYKVWLE